MSISGRYGRGRPGQPTLIELARSSPNRKTRIWAIQQIEDQEVLKELARQENDRAVLRAALRCITDDPFLTELGKASGDKNILRAVVQTVSDQAFLAEMAKTQDDQLIRTSALERLTDQALLADVAAFSEFKHIRRAAFVQVTDPEQKVWTALNNPHPHFRKEALSPVFPQETLEEIALGDTDSGVRALATSMLRKPGPLTQIAESDDAERVRDVASQALDALAESEEVCRTDEDYQTRQKAFRHLGREGSQEALLDVCLNDQGVSARLKAVLGLRGDEALKRVFEDSSFDDTRRRALAMIHDQEYLAALVSKESDEELRAAAMQNLHDGQIIHRDLLSSADGGLRRWTYAHLRSPDTIESLIGLGLTVEDLVFLYSLPQAKGLTPLIGDEILKGTDFPGLVEILKAALGERDSAWRKVLEELLRQGSVPPDRFAEFLDSYLGTFFVMEGSLRLQDIDHLRNFVSPPSGEEPEPSETDPAGAFLQLPEREREAVASRLKSRLRENIQRHSKAYLIRVYNEERVGLADYLYRTGEFEETRERVFVHEKTFPYYRQGWAHAERDGFDLANTRYLLYVTPGRETIGEREYRSHLFGDEFKTYKAIARRHSVRVLLVDLVPREPVWFSERFDGPPPELPDETWIPQRQIGDDLELVFDGKGPDEWAVERWIQEIVDAG
jgi:hypothetical protein